MTYVTYAIRVQLKSTGIFTPFFFNFSPKTAVF
jgi:hypothetical protein